MFENSMPFSVWITDGFQALPLMNIVFGKLVGDFNQYFIPGAAPSEQTFKSSVNQSRLGFHPEYSYGLS
jgi:hypothetical protein